MVYILPGNRARSLVQRSSITPPLRGSRREGAARFRAGGGPTRRHEKAQPAVEPEGGQRHLPGITTLPGNKSRLPLKNVAKGSMLFDSHRCTGCTGFFRETTGLYTRAFAIPHRVFAEVSFLCRSVPSRQSCASCASMFNFRLSHSPIHTSSIRSLVFTRVHWWFVVFLLGSLFSSLVGTGAGAVTLDAIVIW